MDLVTFAEVLTHFPRSPETAKTAVEIAQDWVLGATPEARLKKVYRCIKMLSWQDKDDSPDSKYAPAMDIRDFLIKLPKPAKAMRGQPERMYLDNNAIATFFMTDAIALQLLLGRRSINPTLASAATIELDNAEEIARNRLDKVKGGFGALAGKLRIVPDGFDRMLAAIDPGVLRVIIDALIRKRWVEFDYTSSQGKASTRKLGPLGLVVKDGSIYLVALNGMKSTPDMAFPIHRMSNARLGLQPFHHAPFDLDAWLDQTGQLNHPQDDVGKSIILELMVAPGSIWHFRERPLGPDQVINEPASPDDWYKLMVTTKRWYTLTSFLASFGPYIKILGPPEVLEGDNGIVAWARNMAQLYE
jgi:hypothetical protein